MEPEIIECEYYQIGTTHGTWFVPCDATVNGELKPYVDGEILYVEQHQGWLARLRMPGYMDCTEWCGFETEEAAKEYLLDIYGTKDDGPREEWEEELKTVEPEIIECEYYLIESTHFTYFIPCSDDVEAYINQHVKGDVISVERRQGWLARYPDRTEWCGCDTEKAAKDYLRTEFDCYGNWRMEG
jgi:hypothetical protein